MLCPMNKIGFDNEKYLKLQSQNIRDRISKFGGKLYLEFGGKLFDDYHASRVVPGFKPDSKVNMLLEMKDDAEIVDISISETLTRTMNTSITTFIVVLMLFIFGASSIRDFTLAMLTGIIVGTYSSLLIAGPLWYVIKTSFGKKKAISKSNK